MREAIVLLGVLVSAIAFTVWMARRIRIQAASRSRLGQADREIPPATAETPVVRPFVRSQVWVAYLVGFCVAGLLYFLAGAGPIFSASFALIVTLMGLEFDQIRVERAIARVERQLADSLDLIIASLSAGVGVLQALESALAESKEPLRHQWEYIVGRIRLGDDAKAVFATLERVVPLATFRLFATVMTVHWEVGGSLTGPLSIVARTIRDRIEMSRRVRSLTMQGRASVAAILGTTYFIGVVIWRSDPDRMVQFLGTSLGQGVLAVALILQAMGIVWTARLSKLSF